MVVLQLWLTNKKYYLLEKNITTLIIGNSRPECSFNDSLIHRTKNISLVAEPYFYTYIKLRKLLESNKGIKQVLLEFSDISLSNKNMNSWTFETVSIKYLYTKYATIMTADEKSFIFSKNPIEVVRSSSFLLRENLLFITAKNKNLLSYKQMGGFVAKSESHIEELRRTQNTTPTKNATDEIALLNLQYLDKIVNLCKKHHIRLYFLRSPVHPIYKLNAFDKVYDSVLQARYPTIDLIDFANYNLNDTEYFDAHHLNYKGARKVSVSMDRIVKMLYDTAANPIFKDHRFTVLH